MKRRHKKWIANLLILAGIAVISYPVGTWGYAWWEQRALEKELTRDHPELALESEEYFGKDMTPLREGEGSSGDQGDELDEDRHTLHGAAAETDRMSRIEVLGSKAKEYALEMDDKPGTPLGKLMIPKIDLETVLIEGTGRGDLREGPGHWPETPMPGMGGNFVVSGHRTTYGGPFFSLDKLEVGDTIRIVLPYMAATYEVSRSLIVYPDEVEVVAQRDVEELSLTTCHPIYSARQRLIVKAEMVEFSLIQEDGQAAESASAETEETVAR